MEISMFFGPLLGVSPALVLWIAAVVFAAVRLQRGGVRAERFLVAGASLEIISNLLIVPMAFIPVWLAGGGYSTYYAVSVASGCAMFLNVIGMAGIICLVYAFWLKFEMRNSVGAVFLPQN